MNENESNVNEQETQSTGDQSSLPQFLKIEYIDSGEKWTDNQYGSCSGIYQRFTPNSYKADIFLIKERDPEKSICISGDWCVYWYENDEGLGSWRLGSYTNTDSFEEYIYGFKKGSGLNYLRYQISPEEKYNKSQNENKSFNFEFY